MSNILLRYHMIPADFMGTAMVPIIKNKTGDTSDNNTYRPIALVTATAKFFKSVFLIF